MWRIHFQAEKETERIRHRLRDYSTGFSPDLAFRSVDAYGSGFISVEQLQQLFEKFDKRVRMCDIEMLVRKYSKGKSDKKLSYLEFADELMPKSPLKLY